jgi:hypothetical protein
MKTRVVLLLALLASRLHAANDMWSILVVNSGTTNVAHFGFNTGIGWNSTPVACGSTLADHTIGDIPAGSAKLFNFNAGQGNNYPMNVAFGPSGGVSGGWPVGVTNLGACVVSVSGNGALLTFHVQAGGPATNCTFPINLQNEDVYPKTFALFHNGVLTGTYWFLPGLSSLQDSYVVPNCDFEGYIVRVVLNGTINGGNLTDLGNGAGRIDGGSTGGILTAPPNGDTGNLLGGTNQFAPLQLAPGAAGTNQTTNGPIAYGTNAANNPTNGAVNGVIQAGDNALYTATVNGDNSLLQAIDQVDSDLKANTASTSNMLGQVTNALAHLTNGGSSGSNVDYSGVLGQIESNTAATATNTGFLTNFVAATNQLASNFLGQLTNMQSSAQTAGGSITNAFGSALGGFPTAPTIGSGVDGVSIATVPGQPDVLISVASLPASFDTPRTVISWVVWLMTYITMVRFAQEKVLRIMNQRQTQGSQEEILGCNATVPTAFAYAAVIAATVAAVPTAIASYLQTASSSISSFSGLSTLASHPLWNLMTQLVPVSVIITAFFSYLTFRYLVAFPLIIVSVTLIMFLLV